MLMRYHHGERQVWQVVKVPSVEAEDQRHLHRDLETLKQERASTMTRIEGLLSSQGLRVTSLTKLPEQLEALRLWDGSPLPPGLRRRGWRSITPFSVSRLLRWKRSVVPSCRPRRKLALTKSDN